MSKKTALKLTALAAAFAATAVPMTAAAEVSGSLSIANMYFWRGVNIGAPQVAGSIDYGHESGAYAGIWASSEGALNGEGEYDLYAGFGGEAGGLSYDISYWDYNYPDQSSLDLEEVVVSLGMAGVTATAYIGVGEIGHGDTAVDNESNYYTLGYSYDKYSINVGTWDAATETDNYTHVDLSYALTDNFTFTASKVVDQDTEGASALLNGVDGVDDVLFVVSYSFDL